MTEQERIQFLNLQARFVILEEKVDKIEKRLEILEDNQESE